MSKILVINRGSASEKYAIYEEGKSLGFLHLEKADGCQDYASTLYFNNSEEILESKEEKCITKKEFNNSLNYALNLFRDKGILVGKNIKEAKKEISGTGIRIVAPGKYFQADKIIDNIYEKEVKKVLHNAPLHILPTFELIKELKKVFKKVPIVGISDSDFHDTLPEKAKYYGLPFSDTKKYQLERFGYHGISIESILHKLKSEGPIPERLIICHIGSGVSLTAIKNGISVDNSMGFTPLEGVMMATRAGDIDPGTVAFIGERLNLKGNKLQDYLNKKCGLLGVSEKSSDVRDLLTFEKQGDAQAKLALDMYAYKLQKQIGAYFAVLGGLDTIVFTATVGERSFIMRERICDGLESLGIKIDKIINNQSEGVDADITAPASGVKVLVRKTDEMGQIARDTILVLSHQA